MKAQSGQTTHRTEQSALAQTLHRGVICPQRSHLITCLSNVVLHYCVLQNMANMKQWEVENDSCHLSFPKCCKLSFVITAFLQTYNGKTSKTWQVTLDSCHWPFLFFVKWHVPTSELVKKRFATKDGHIPIVSCQITKIDNIQIVTLTICKDGTCH